MSYIDDDFVSELTDLRSYVETVPYHKELFVRFIQIQNQYGFNIEFPEPENNDELITNIDDLLTKYRNLTFDGGNRDRRNQGSSNSSTTSFNTSIIQCIKGGMEGDCTDPLSSLSAHEKQKILLSLTKTDFDRLCKTSHKWYQSCQGLDYFFWKDRLLKDYGYDLSLEKYNTIIDQYETFKKYYLYLNSKKETFTSNFDINGTNWFAYMRPNNNPLGNHRDNILEIWNEQFSGPPLLLSGNFQGISPVYSSIVSTHKRSVSTSFFLFRDNEYIAFRVSCVTSNGNIGKYYIRKIGLPMTAPIVITKLRQMGNKIHYITPFANELYPYKDFTIAGKHYEENGVLVANYIGINYLNKIEIIVNSIVTMGRVMTNSNIYDVSPSPALIANGINLGGYYYVDINGALNFFDERFVEMEDNEDNFIYNFNAPLVSIASSELYTIGLMANRVAVIWGSRSNDGQPVDNEEHLRNTQVFIYPPRGRTFKKILIGTKMYFAVLDDGSLYKNIIPHVQRR